MSAPEATAPSLLLTGISAAVKGVEGLDVFGRMLIDMVIKHQNERTHEPH
jgi:hypothetical protein